MHVLVGFLKSDDAFGSARRSNKVEMNLNLHCSGCKPRSIVKSIKVPLPDIKARQVRRGSTNVLIKVTTTADDGRHADYPYAEMTIEKGE